MIDLTSKLGEIDDIEHNKGSKIHHQNQVILDCIMPSIPLKHKCLSIISRSGLFFTFLNWEKTNMVLGKKVTIFHWEWALGKGRKSPVQGFSSQTLLCVLAHIESNDPNEYPSCINMGTLKD